MCIQARFAAVCPALPAWLPDCLLAAGGLPQTAAVQTRLQDPTACAAAQVYIIEANPRASRTVPFVAKAIGHPLAKYASLLMSGQTLPQLGFTQEPRLQHVAVKEAVLPFEKFPGAPASPQGAQCPAAQSAPGCQGGYPALWEITRRIFCPLAAILQARTRCWTRRYA